MQTEAFDPAGTVERRLRDIMRDLFEQPELEINESMMAKDVESWDSLNHTLLIVEIEKAFGARLPVAEVARLEHVGALVKCVKKTLAKSHR